MKDVYNIFRPITEDVGKLLNMQIYYTYGSWDEIVVELSDMAKDPRLCQDRYPLIALVGDVQVNHSDPTIFGEGTFNLLIATLTQQTLTPSERIELSFKPILWPIHETLINQFLYSHDFDVQDIERLSYTSTDRLNWGKSQIFYNNNGGTDFIDAITIENLKLKIKR